MNRASLPPTPYPVEGPVGPHGAFTGPLHPDRSRSWFILPALLLAIGLGLALPKEARADPHAVFYTDNGFKQVFYAVLAALNQADYVEPPTQPTPAASPSPGYIDEFNYTKLDPDEVRLPRIRVRAVTPDDGDVYYRQQYAEVVRAARVRAELSALACKFYEWADPAEFGRHRECRENTGS